MRLERLRLELGGKLAPEIPGMGFNFADLDVRAIRRLTGDPETVRGQYFFEFPIKFEAMPMALADTGCVISFVRKTAGFQHAGPRSQPHGSAQFVDALQLAKLVDDTLGGSRV